MKISLNDVIGIIFFNVEKSRKFLISNKISTFVIISKNKKCFPSQIPSRTVLSEIFFLKISLDIVLQKSELLTFDLIWGGQNISLFQSYFKIMNLHLEAFPTMYLVIRSNGRKKILSIFHLKTTSLLKNNSQSLTLKFQPFFLSLNVFWFHNLPRGDKGSIMPKPCENNNLNPV